MLNIFPISALQDNYIWAIANSAGKVAVVDPGDAAPVIAALQKRQLSLVSILITHYHSDHTAGIPGLLAYQNVPVHGPKNQHVPQLTHSYKDGDLCKIDELAVKFKVLAIPGHTLDHIAFVNDEALFCGDTLFMAGCGRIFEGTPKQMLKSLNKIKSLPTNPLIYCAHEYTKKNLQFAQLVEPNNLQIKERLKQVENLRQQALPTVPGSLATELLTNPFLRIDNREVIHTIQNQFGSDERSADKLFGLLRKWKDEF